MKKLIAFSCVAALYCAATVSAEPIPVDNHSFENAGLASGGWSNCIDVACGEADPDWWINPDPGGVSNTNTAFAEVIDGFVADGTHHVGIDSDSPNLEVAQNLGIEMLPFSVYTLTVAVGNRNANFSPLDSLSTIALYVGGSATGGGSQLAAATFPAGEVLGASEFIDVTLTFATSDFLVGGDMWISLQNSGAGRSHFDNVRLDVVPEPTGLLMLVLGVVGLAVRRRRG